MSNFLSFFLSRLFPSEQAGRTCHPNQWIGCTEAARLPVPSFKVDCPPARPLQG
jgi:hypothetical protein